MSVCDAAGKSGVINPDRLLFFAHICCWKFARQRYLLSNLRMYKLAKQARPILRLEKPPLRSVQLPDYHLVDTNLATLLSRINSLPFELQLEVFRFLPHHLTASLIQALQTATLLKPITQEGPIRERVRLLYDGAVRLHGSTISIFGEICLHQIGFIDERTKGNLGVSIPVQVSVIQGIKFSLGVYGLKAVRMLYRDGSSSPWLGEPGIGY